MRKLTALIILAIPLLAQKIDYRTQIINKPTVDLSEYVFSAAPGGSISAGVAKTVTMTPCPRGLSGSDVGHWVYVSNGTGTAEPVLITGGTCTSGAATGTIIFTAANSHSASWTVSSASFGLAEAIYTACSSGGGTISVPGGTYTPHGTITIPSTCGGLSIIGASGTGIYSTVIRRTEDYGSTMVMGTSTTGVNNVLISNIKFTHYINYQPSPAPGSIINRPTNGAHVVINGGNSIRFNNVRFENMPYNVVLNGGADITFDNCQWHGLWDPDESSTQVTNASLQVNYTAALGIPTYIKVFANQFYGYASAAVGKHNSGPKYMVEVNSCEDLEIDGGAMGGAAIANLRIHPTTSSYILSNLRVRGVKFDSARSSDVLIESDGAKSAGDVIFANNVFNGENESDYAIDVPNAGTGTPSIVGVNVSGNNFLAYRATPIHLLDGRGWGVFSNIIRYYNSGNDYSTAEMASGIYIGGVANDYMVNGNMIGGGQAYSEYGSGGNYCVFGIQIADRVTANRNGKLWGNYPPYYSAIGTYGDPIFETVMLSYPDATVRFGAASAVAGSVTLAAVNDDVTLNIPLEIRATKTVLPVGGISAKTVNYISSETGGNSAIAGTLSDIPLVAGLQVSIKIAHTLQAGANTFAYNGGSAAPIKSHRNPANDIGVAYASGAVVSLVYDGTNWQDVSQ